MLPDLVDNGGRASRLDGYLWFAAVVIGFQLLVFSVYEFFRAAPRPELSDFRQFYVAAQIGAHSGWQHIYDPAYLQRALDAAWPGSPFISYVNPPLLAAFMVPVSLLPPDAAFWTWVIFDACAILACTLVLAGRSWRARLPAALSSFAFLPTYSVLSYGTVVPLVTLALTATWVLLQRNRQWLAGLALSLLVVKPQVAFLVPLTLLVGGWWRCSAACAAAAGSLFIAGLALVGQHGIESWMGNIAQVERDPFYSRYSVYGLAGGGVPGLAAAALIGAVAAAASWLSRGGGPEVPLSAGIAGSLLAAPHVTLGDFTVLLVPVILLLRTSPPLEVVILLGLVWFAGWTAPGPALPVMAAEAALLAVLIGYAVQGGRWPHLAADRPGRAAMLDRVSRM